MDEKAIIREKALQRISKTFAIPVEDLTNDMEFGKDLTASFVSDFRNNEFDLINDDIHDVADKQTTKEMENGVLTIRTVGDYCNHMVRCHEFKPSMVKKILAI